MSDHDLKILFVAAIFFFIGCIAGFLIGKASGMKEEKSKMVVTCMLVGGFGNNLFIILATIGYSLRHNIAYCIPTVIENPHYEGQKVFWSPRINYKNINFGQHHEPITVHTEPSFTYEEIPKYDDCDILLLRGYYQSPKYFLDYLPQLKKILALDCKTKHSYTVCLHVRRGDYLNYPSIHPTVNVQYLREAVLRFDKLYTGMEWRFRFYSDDIPYCKAVAHNIFYDKPDQYEFSEGKTEEEDFRDMLGCRHFIISNSSFSLLAAILSESPDKVVFAPRTWFGPSMSHDIKDLLMPEFILI